MTITTSKQLAEALGPKWRAAGTRSSIAAIFDGTGVLVDFRPFVSEAWQLTRAGDGGPTPRAAVLALADKLEAEARALRESVK